jgi:hypothetical protein
MDHGCKKHKLFVVQKIRQKILKKIRLIRYARFLSKFDLLSAKQI